MHAPMAATYDSTDFTQRLESLSESILKTIPSGAAFNLVGIRTRGEVIARRLLDILKNRTQAHIGFGALDITLYRDDLSEVGPRPLVRPTVLSFDIDKRPLILVDDVLFTGRTVRAALDALADYGRPSAVRLAVLVDRGGRELPIQADVCALSLGELPLTQVVKVKVAERDGYDGIEIESRV
jgi:pyrimidine operon attenuation protein / uracil phosphoribosyltransferase